MPMACPGEQCRLLSCQLQTAPVRDWGVLSPSVSLKACSSLRKCKILSALLSAFIYLFIYFAEFSTRCYNCSRNLRGALCGSCKSFGLQCVICHVAVRGNSQKKIAFGL